MKPFNNNTTAFLFLLLLPPILGARPPPTAAVDAIYVIGMPQCKERWRRVRTWARSRRLRITPLYGTPFGDVQLRHPPIPVVNVPPRATVKAGQVACTASHMRVWRHAFARNYSRVVVLEDDVRMRDALIDRIPRIVGDAEEGVRRRGGMPWHYLYLRMHPTVVDLEKGEEVWHGALKVAPPGWGTAAYMASHAGIRYLLTRVTAYAYPLDVQIERLQKGLDTQGADFVALHACDNADRGFPAPGCPENIHEISEEERGNCYYSASQSGQILESTEVPQLVKS